MRLCVSSCCQIAVASNLPVSQAQHVTTCSLPRVKMSKKEARETRKKSRLKQGRAAKLVRKEQKAKLEVKVSAICNADFDLTDTYCAQECKDEAGCRDC